MRFIKLIKIIIIKHQVLDRTHYLLATLQGEIHSDVFNYNRLKPCYIKASSVNKNITDVSKLKEILEKNTRDKVHFISEGKDSYFFCDETGTVLPSLTSSDILCVANAGPMDISQYVLHSKENTNLAFPSRQQTATIAQHLALTAKSPTKGYTAKKARFKAGHLQILLRVTARR